MNAELLASQVYGINGLVEVHKGLFASVDARRDAVEKLEADLAETKALVFLVELHKLPHLDLADEKLDCLDNKLHRYQQKIGHLMQAISNAQTALLSAEEEFRALGNVLIDQFARLAITLGNADLLFEPYAGACSTVSWDLQSSFEINGRSYDAPLSQSAYGFKCSNGYAIILRIKELAKEGVDMGDLKLGAL